MASAIRSWAWRPAWPAGLDGRVQRPLRSGGRCGWARRVGRCGHGFSSERVVRCLDGASRACEIGATRREVTARRAEFGRLVSLWATEHGRRRGAGASHGPAGRDRHWSLVGDRRGQSPASWQTRGYAVFAAARRVERMTGWPRSASNVRQVDVTERRVDRGAGRPGRRRDPAASTCWSTTPATGPTAPSRRCRWTRRVASSTSTSSGSPA